MPVRPSVFVAARCSLRSSLKTTTFDLLTLHVFLRPCTLYIQQVQQHKEIHREEESLNPVKLHCPPKSPESRYFKGAQLVLLSVTLGVGKLGIKAWIRAGKRRGLVQRPYLSFPNSLRSSVLDACKCFTTALGVGLLRIGYISLRPLPVKLAMSDALLLVRSLLGPQSSVWSLLSIVSGLNPGKPISIPLVVKERVNGMESNTTLVASSLGMIFHFRKPEVLDEPSSLPVRASVLSHSLNQVKRGRYDGGVERVVIGLIMACQTRNQQAQQPPPPPHQDDHRETVIKFQRLTPPAFTGVEGPIAVAEWIHKLERMFNLLMCTDEQKIVCAEYQMEGDADTWCHDHWRLRPGERANLTWDRMQEGTQTVDEYERDFTFMSAFAPTLVDTEVKKATQFCDGLHPDVCMHLTSQRNLPYGETVIHAHQFENYQKLIASAPSQPLAQSVQPITSVHLGSNSNKRKDDSRRDNRKRKRGGNDRRGERPVAQSQYPKCHNCGRYHSEECRYTQRVCYNCMKPGHFFSACPEPNRQQGYQQPQQQQQFPLPPHQ
ncbi:gag-pol polyprotein [Striga asiatica]|uniref:Gag-pol polyprotein n=1 Tax=Striga asiatica TaxID=4170 RepID=A0A5A7R0L2_STRAF|nr:gag-pol polyprotein [Striga asiatica]